MKIKVGEVGVRKLKLPFWMQRLGAANSDSPIFKNADRNPHHPNTVNQGSEKLRNGNIGRRIFLFMILLSTPFVNFLLENNFSLQKNKMLDIKKTCIPDSKNKPLAVQIEIYLKNQKVSERNLRRCKCSTPS